MLELPQTRGCLVCGHANPHGLHLRLFADAKDGAVHVDYTPTPQHIGFEGIVHGGAIATVVDEAMVWAATWAGKRFCVAADLYVRFKHSATVGQPLHVTARVTEHRARLIQTACEVRDTAGLLIATAEAKYVPVSPERHAACVATFVDDPATRTAANALASTA